MTTTDLVPWQVHPGLTKERLTLVASLIREARHQVVRRQEPSMGDDYWVLGCRAFKWSCFAIAQAASQNSEWLTITEGGALLDDSLGGAVLHGHRFVFSIGGVPFRFFRGSADEVPSRSLRRHYPEIHAQQTAFSFVDSPEADSVYRLAVETDDLGEAERIVLLEVETNEDPDESGEPLRKYVIPEQDGRESVAEFPTRSKGRELGKPSVGVKKESVSSGEDNE